MTKTTQKMQKALVISGFKDAGSGERFEAGATETIDARVFENYRAAGLVRKARATRASSKGA